MRPLYRWWLVTMGTYGHRQVGNQRGLHIQLHLGQLKWPGSSRWSWVPCCSDGLCPILLNLPLERPIKCVPEGFLYPKFCYSGLKWRNFIVVPTLLWNEWKWWEKGRERTQNFQAAAVSSFKKELIQLRNMKGKYTAKSYSVHTKAFTVVKELIIQLLLVLLLASFHRRQQLENKA